MASIPLTAPSAPALSEYEQARARNIERNNARLRSLGLIGKIEERRSNDMAWGRQNCGSVENFASDDGDSSSHDEYVEGDNTSKTKKKKKRSHSALSPKEGSRKSRRLMNLSTQNDSDDILNDGRETSTKNATERKDRLQMEREKLVSECREARLRVANELAMAGVVDAAAGNPTASYEHCLMRVRSMTEKGLANRIRAIERAAGKHCVVKMAIFKSCLQDEDMWNLATLASESLERLKAFLPPP